MLARYIIDLVQTGRVKRLFERNGPLGPAYLVPDGSIDIDFSPYSSFSIRAKNMLVGAEELLIAETDSGRTRRMYGAQIEDPVTPKEHSYDEIRVLLSQFEYGVHYNRFVSALLEKLSSTLTFRRSALTQEERGHEARALLFSGLVLELEQVLKQGSSIGLSTIVSQARQKALFETGISLRKERRFASVRLQGVPLRRLVQRIPQNSMLCREGDPAASMFVLLDGEVAVMQQGKQIARIHEPGEAFGEMALFLEGRRTASLVAASECSVYKIEEDDLGDFHRSHPDVFFNIGATLAARLAAVLEQLERYDTASGGSPTDGLNYPSATRDEGRSTWDALWQTLTALQQREGNEQILRIMDRYLSHGK